MIVHCRGVEIYNGTKDGKNKHWQRLTLTQPMQESTERLYRSGETSALVYIPDWLGIPDQEVKCYEGTDLDLIYDTQLGNEKPQLIGINKLGKEDT